MILSFEFTDEGLAHLKAQKNNMALNRRIQKITGIKKADMMNFLDNEPLLFDKCQFCGSNKKFNFKYEVKDERVHIKDIKYLNDTKVCGRRDNDTTKNCPQRYLNPNSIEFVQKAYGFNTIEEANQYILNRNKSPFYRNNHKTDEEYKNYQTRDEKWYQSQGKCWEEHKQKLSYTHSLEYYIEKYGKERGIKIYEDICSRKDSSSECFFRNKYGDDWEKYYNLKNFITSHSLGQYIHRHGLEKGTREYDQYCESQRMRQLKILNTLTVEERRLMYDSTSKDFFKRKYGDDWEKYYKRKQVTSQVKFSKQSKESLKFFELLIDEIAHINLNYYIGVDGNKEYFIYDNENKKFNLYDFTLRELNIIIEFHGSLWHFNPNYEYPETLPFNLSLEENKKNDIYKETLANKHGFEYYVVFDTDNYVAKQKELGEIIKTKCGDLNEKRNV